MLRLRPSMRGLALSLGIGSTLPRLRTDPTHLRQILVNLITNARNAVKERPGNTDPLITLVVQQDVSWTTAAVTAAAPTRIT